MSIKAAAPARFSALPVQLKAKPPAHPSLGFARPVPQGPVLLRPGDGTHGQRRRILPDNGIRALRLAVAMQPQGQQGPPLPALPIRRPDNLAVSPERRELLPMLRLEVKVDFGLVPQATPRAPD